MTTPTRSRSRAEPEAAKAGAGAARSKAAKGRPTKARRRPLPPAELERLKLSPEVAWYLQSRGFDTSELRPPMVKTPEPGEWGVEGAVFDPERVDKVLRALHNLRHTQGEWYGRPLDPMVWQVAYVIAPVFGWVAPQEDGRLYRIVRRLYVEVPRKNGKFLQVDTPVLTGGGFRRIADLAEGDTVYAADGSPTPVTFVSEVHRRPGYIVRLASGKALTAADTHRWTVLERDTKTGSKSKVRPGFRRRVLTTRDMVEAGLRAGNGARFMVEVPAPPDTHPRDLPLDPYVLGLWLGDGSRGCGVVTGVDMGVFAEVEARGYEVRHRTEIKRHQIIGIVGHLRALGVLHDKHIPEGYLTGSIQQRLDLLRGLMDSDGYAESPKHHRTPRVEFVSKDRALADGVLELARSLGFKPTLREGRARLNGEDYGVKYRVLWTAWNDDLAPFGLARKRDRLAKRPDSPTRAMRDAVVAVEPVGVIDGVCIAIEHGSHTYLAGRDYFPTHNTTIGAGLTAYLAFADGEPGAQVTCAATNEKQARFAFDPLRKLARETPALRPNVQVLAKKILHPRSASYVEVATSAADALHGANMHGGLIDELHVHKTPDLVEVIETGTGSRRQPLILLITTADDSRQDTIYARRHDYTESLSRRTINDPTFYGVVFAAPKDADPFAEETWAAANPGYPVTPTRGYLRSAASEAQQSPAELAKFLRLHLNVRTKQESRYFPMELWDRNTLPVDWEALRGRVAFGGCDLASTSDVTALAWVVPDPDDLGVYDVRWRFWVPEDTLPDLDRRTAGNASVWVRQGFLETTPGNVTDYEFVRQDILADSEHVWVQSLALDRWNATHLASRLQEDGLPVVLMGQGVAHMSAPTKEMRRLLGLGGGPPRLRNGGNPVARWMADHFAVEMDALGNVKPSKKKAADKIDGIVALIMALDRATSEQVAAPNIAYV